MNENEFELDGKVYMAVSATRNSMGSTCEGCVANKVVCKCFKCMPYQRKDNRNVIFVEKHQ